MPSRHFPAFLVALLFSTTAAAESIQFRFAPEGGSRWLRVGEDRNLREMGPAAPIVETTTRQEVELLYEKSSDGRWKVVQTPRSVGYENGGVPTVNPILDLTIGSEIRLGLDAGGKAVSASGFRQLLRKLEDNLPAPLFAQVSSNFNEAAMVEGEKQRWNAELGPLRDQSVEIGERWHLIEYRGFAMGGKHQVEGVMRFEGWTELDGVRGLKVIYDWDTTGEAVEKWGSADMKRIDLRDPGDSAVGGNLTMSGTDLRVIVPSSGQLLYRTMDQISMLTEVEGVDLGDNASAVGRFEDHSVYRWHRVDAQD